MSEIIKQGIFSSIEEIAGLGIIDFNRCNGLWDNNPAFAMKSAENWMVGTMGYTIADVTMSKYPNRNDWPGWEHAGHHEALGRTYWNWFFSTKRGTLTFADMPDFEGTICLDEAQEDIHFYGDIGQVSASTFIIDVLPRMDKGDLWISIPYGNRQIILEALVPLRDMIQAAIQDTLID